MHLNSWLAFSLIALGLVLSPGPNQAYLISRTVCQGRGAGLVSLLGVALGFVIYALLAAIGLSALIAREPRVYDVIRIVGALYLGWLAWKALRPGGHSPFVVTDLPFDPPSKLFLMGCLTNLLNPKAAALYLSLLPQFIDPSAGNTFAQTLILGSTQIAISFVANAIIVLVAGSFAGLINRRPRLARTQRWVMGCVLAALAMHLVIA